jgi:hypothetical protein
VPRRTSDITTYVLVAAMIVLGVVVFVLDRGRGTTSEQTARAGMLIHVWRQDDVTRVTVDRKGERIDIVRDGEGWKLTSPRAANADFLAVTALLNALGGARSERAVGNATADDRKTFGLDPPRATVEVAMKGVTVRVSLGASVTGSDGNAPNHYVEVAPYADDKGGVFVVAAEVARAIDRGSDVYREPSLLAANKSMEFARVAITTHAGGSLVLDRGPHGEWRLASGAPEAPIRADADAADGLFGALGDLKADPFVPDETKVDVAQGGSVQIDLKNGGKLDLAYGGPCPSTVDAGTLAPTKLVVVQLKTPQTITGCVPSVVLERLEHPAARYVDTHALGLLFGSESAKISEIEAVTIEHAGQKVVDAERRNDGLHLRVPSDEQIAHDVSDRFLARIAAISGAIVPKPVDAAKLGLAPPDGRVLVRRRMSTLTTGDPGADGGTTNEWLQTIEIGHPVDLADTKPLQKVVYLHRLDDDAYVRIAEIDARAFGAASALDLRSPNLLELPPETIERIAVTTGIPGAIPYEIERSGSAFSLVTPAGLGADASAISELTHHLSTLTCTRWAADRDDGSFGLATPQATIAIRRTPPAIVDAAAVPTEIAIDFGSSTNDGGIHARVRGRDAVCVLPEAKLVALLRPPVDRTVVGFDPTDAPRFVIARPGGSSRTITFDGKAWHDGSDAGTPNADAIAAKLADLVVGLRVERLVRLGPALPTEGFGTPTLTIQSFDAAGKPKKHVVIGASGKLASALVYYARVDGIDGTYSIAREDVEKIITGM